MTTEPWAVEFERRADKDLERLDPQVKQRVLTAVGRLADDPRRADLLRLKGRAECRGTTFRARSTARPDALAQAGRPLSVMLTASCPAIASATRRSSGAVALRASLGPR